MIDKIFQEGELNLGKIPNQAASIEILLFWLLLLYICFAFLEKFAHIKMMQMFFIIRCKLKSILGSSQYQQDFQLPMSTWKNI